MQKFRQSNIMANMFYDKNGIAVAKDYVEQKIRQTIHDEYIIRWNNELERNLSGSGLGGNKLRTYNRTFKHVYGTETYISNILPRSHRSTYAKFRCGVAPIRLETGRYERLNVEQRTCFQCPQRIDTEEHVLFICPFYEDSWLKLFDKVINYFPFLRL